MSKRVFDITIATAILIVSAVPMVIIALLIRWRMGSPVLFSQTRPGRNAQLFKMYKFRSMTNAPADAECLSDATRLTRLGRFLRATSLDELPELWNVLKGDMSLVGPRPLLVEYLPLYCEEQARRHDVRPGITGWAQVNGRNSIGWDEKLVLDVWYVEHRSFRLDLKIIWLTLWKVVGRHGIAATGAATMPKFTGTKAR